MNILNKMERKFGRHAIHNLSIILIGCYIAGYVIEIFSPNILFWLTLEPAYILRGQVWRLITWVLIPPERFSIFTVIMLFLYYSLGTTLERTWGAFRYNVYIFSGILFTVIGAFIVYFATGSANVGLAFSTYYINMSIFLAFAASYPNMQLMLYFIIPIKIKWMGLLYGAIIIYEFVRNSWMGRAAIFASLLNFILFFIANRNYNKISPKEIKRKQTFRKEVNSARAVTKHKCAICGRTEDDNPDLEFRFCSKCEGNYEYCQDHLFTHEHVHRH